MHGAQICFFPPACTARDTSFVVNRFIDCVFILDAGLQFFLMYPHTEGREGARWEGRPSLIAIHYLTGWFWLDVTSILVSIFDFVSLGSCSANGNAAVSNLSKLRVLRVLRVLRLVKMLRLLRMSRIFKRWETKVAINYAAVALTRAFASVFLWSHLAACLWTLQTDLFHEDKATTWLGHYGLCVNVPDPANATLTIEQCASPGELYVTSMYWSVMTITSIGYGDVAATRMSERVVAIAVMLAGSVLWGNTIATFCSVVATFNPERVEFTHTSRLLEDVEPRAFVRMHPCIS